MGIFKKNKTNEPLPDKFAVWTPEIVKAIVRFMRGDDEKGYYGHFPVLVEGYSMRGDLTETKRAIYGTVKFIPPSITLSAVIRVDVIDDDRGFEIVRDRMLKGVKKRASGEAGNFAGSLSFKSYGTYGNCDEESYLPCLAFDLFLRPVAWERINEHLHLLAGGEKQDMVIGIRVAYQSKQPPKSFIEQNNFKIPKIVGIGLKTSLALNVQKVIVNPGFMDDEYCGP